MPSRWRPSFVSTTARSQSLRQARARSVRRSKRSSGSGYSLTFPSRSTSLPLSTSSQWLADRPSSRASPRPPAYVRIAARGPRQRTPTWTGRRSVPPSIITPSLRGPRAAGAPTAWLRLLPARLVPFTRHDSPRVADVAPIPTRERPVRDDLGVHDDLDE